MKKVRPREFYSFADLQNWSAATRSVSPPIRLGVLGDPVAHSRSPDIQNAALEHAKIDAQFVRLQIGPAELPEALKLLRDRDFLGLNLTLPHKIAALDHLDSVEENARQVGAVNTIRFANGKSTGFNTDGKGFARAIREQFSVDLRDLRILILGAGGAARAIALQCAKEHCERLVIANRTFERASTLADSVRNFFVGPKVSGPVARLQAVPWEESALRFQIGHVDLVVHATPRGLNAGDASPLPARLIEPHLMIYDCVYAQQRRTPLLNAAQEAGARGADGVSMLLHQAALAFEIWFGKDAPIDAMRAAL